MLRITTLYPDAGHCLLRLEGRVAGIWVEELQRQCARELAHQRQLTLEMSGVRYLDQGARNLLWDLVDKGAILEKCSPFVSEQLRRKK